MTTAYDRVPYASRPYPQTHPDHLAAVATMLGRSPPPVERARVLEIGCGSGRNLLPLAAALPDATFVGVDPAATAIAEARAHADALGLANVALLAAGVEDLPAGEPFDYVVAHGVLSWVPAPVRAAIWRVLGERLAPDGVAFVSSNAMPGWSVRGAVCRVLREATRGHSDPLARAAAARSTLAELCAATPADGDWGRLLHAERRRMDALEDWYLVHDHLADENRASWLDELEAAAEVHGLALLGESDPPRRVLPGWALPLADREALVDLAQLRMFRETVVVRAGGPARPPDLRDLSFTLRATCVAPHRYQLPEGGAFTATEPVPRELLAALDAAGRQPLSHAALAGVGPGAAEVLHALVFDLGAARIHRWPRTGPRTLGVRPRVWGWARREAAIGSPFLTNRLHEALAVDPFEREVARRLDGTATRAAFADLDPDRLLRALLRFAAHGLLDG